MVGKPGQELRSGTVVDEEIGGDENDRRAHDVHGGVLLQKHRRETDCDAQQHAADLQPDLFAELFALEQGYGHAERADDVHAREDVRRGVGALDERDEPARDVVGVARGAQGLPVGVDGIDEHAHEPAALEREHEFFKDGLLVEVEVESGDRHVEEPREVGEDEPRVEGNEVVERAVH